MQHLKEKSKSTDKSQPKVTMTQAFKTIIWPRRNLVFIGLILIVVRSLSGLILPWQSKVLLDDVVPNKDYSQLYTLIAIVIAAITVQAVTSFLLTRILSVQAQYLISELRSQVQKKVLSLPISFFDNTKSGALVSRIMTDVEGVRNLIGTGLVQLVGGTFTAVVSLIILIKLNAWMTLFVFVPLSIFGLVALKAFKYIRPIFRTRGKINAEVTGRLTETLSGVRVIKAFNAEEQENIVFEEGVDKLYQNVKKSLTATAVMTSSSTFLIGIATTGIMGMGGYYMIIDEMTVGDFLFFTLILGFMIAPIVQMSNIGSQLTEALAGLDRTEELMNMTAEDDNEERNIQLSNIKGDIEFNDVSFSYEEGKEVLHNINFKAPAGSVTVLQDEFLFEGTIRQNIMFPRPNATEAELLNAVNAAYVNEFTDRFDEGLETLIGERGVKLSGGQRQRLAIARAILANPKIIILDEATSSLDTESEALIQKSLAELIKDRTTIVIAHRLSTIRKADQILVIEAGHIVERGTHDQLIAKEGRYYELYTYQSKI